MSERSLFSVGDLVRPLPEWRDHKQPEIPSGKVTSVEPFGKGQVIRVGDNPMPYVSGIFELDSGE